MWSGLKGLLLQNPNASAPAAGAFFMRKAPKKEGRITYLHPPSYLRKSGFNAIQSQLSWF